VQFVLEPVYKLMTQTVGEDKETLEKVLASLGLYLKRRQYKLNSKSLLKVVMSSLTGTPHCLRDLAVKLVPPPYQSRTFERLYAGDRLGPKYEELRAASSKGPLMVDIVKYYHQPDCSSFDAFGRVLSGTLKKGQVLRVLGENYRTYDPEDMSDQTVTALRVYNTRYRFEVTKVPAGNWVLLEGIDPGVSKTATAVGPDLIGNIERLLPCKFKGSVVKVAIEPFVPSDLPKLLEAIRKVSKSYPQLQFHVEESGEHVLVGSGELYMDSVLHDIRNLYSDIEVKLSDPFVAFNETVIDTSSFKAYADTPNKQNRLSVIAEPLEGKLIEDVEAGVLTMSSEPQELEQKYDWDILASRNLWAFGPQVDGANAFLNDILPGDGDLGLLSAVRESVVQGFQWACREGPLCEESMRGVKFRLIQASLAELPIYRSGGQIIPSVKRVCNSAFLLASPRLLEPYYLTEIQCTQDCMPAILTLLQLRRGHINSEEPKPGSPLYTVVASIPVLEAFGFETDLRTKTSGMAFCLSYFDHWGLVPGDPLDRKIQIRPLEPAPVPHLAREFMLKTRRRKGLTEDIVVSKYFDTPGLLELAREDQDLAQYF
jgi:U5 small nuclear ribonucleoprotein component